MKKRLTALALAFVMVLGTVAVAAGTEKAISVTPMGMTINGQTVTPTKSDGSAAEVFAYDGATYVPLRYLSELLGIQVEWDKNAPNTAKLVNVPGFTSGTYTPGTYTVETSGRNGPMTVEVTFDANGITNISVPAHSETSGIGDVAMEKTSQRIIETQSLAFDALTSATVSCRGLMYAVGKAVDQAGGSAREWQTKDLGTTTQPDVTVDADVVILGAGGAGLAAAVSAAENGAKVVVVEKTAMVGGNTLRAGGWFNAVVPEIFPMVKNPPTATDTINLYTSLEAKNETMARWQRELTDAYAKYQDSGSTDLFDSIYLHMLQTYVDGDYYADPALIENLCSQVPTTYTWLKSLGCDWENLSRLIAGNLWPRAHHSIAENGFGYITALTDYIEKASLPVTIYYEVAAEELIQKGDRITGATGTGTVDGTKYTFNASKGVVVATGGFAANVEMREKYNEQWPEIGAGINNSNSTAITGDGIRMAEAVGADLVDMGLIQFYPFADPLTGGTDGDVGSVTNLVVNKEGKRFVAEDSRRDVLTKAVLSQPDTVAYIISCEENNYITDGVNLYGNPLDQLIAQGKAFKADTLEELAQQLGMDPKVLVETVKNYNTMAEQNYDPEFGKTIFPENYLIGEGPYYASKRTPTVHHTMGGVRVDVDTHVLNVNGSAIPGLYAAGEVTGGLHGGNRLGGNAIGDCLTNGRIAGTNAASGK